jgi:hypothetical protein
MLLCGNLVPPFGIMPGAPCGLEILSRRPLLVMAYLTSSYIVRRIGAPLTGGSVWHGMQFPWIMGLISVLYFTRMGAGIVKSDSLSLLHEKQISDNDINNIIEKFLIKL